MLSIAYLEIVISKYTFDVQLFASWTIFKDYVNKSKYIYGKALFRLSICFFTEN